MPPTRLRIFVSSVQGEFAKERADLKAYLLGDAMLRRFVSEVFLFEDIPARDQHADEVYLHEVGRCDIYLGLFGYEYGSENADGVSPTEREYDHATACDSTRLIFVWGSDEKRRSPKMKSLIRKASNELIRRRVNDINALTSEVYASLVDHLDQLGVLRIPPFDRTACEGASQRNLSRKRIDWFLHMAHDIRNFRLPIKTPTSSLLHHLSLLDGDRPTNAAVMLFGAAPQRYHRPSEIKCVHCLGTEFKRPFTSQQRYEGDLFVLVDQAVEFVLSRIDRAVGTRTESIDAPVRFELPPDAVREAIVNAVAHRDYYSNASVEIRLYADRLEVWNPGALPEVLTPASLRQCHPSIPSNPLIAESLYLAGYIEKAGSGTLAMIDWCRKALLPEPDFDVLVGSFLVTLWRDWLTTENVAKLDLNYRQLKAIDYLKVNYQITNTLYQHEFDISKRTASRDLDDLVGKEIVKKTGTTGRGVYYRLVKGVIKGPKGT